MQILTVTRRFGEHRNAFGFLRLLLASLVIVAHTTELADGNRHREPLTQLFGSLSFGELAVNGFFVISGFLIAASFLGDPDPARYLAKRIARIFPAFVVSSFICIMVVGPLGGGHPHYSLLVTAVGAVLRILILSPPVLFNSFSGTPYPVLNSSSWTIQYEFLCYILVMLFGMIGVLRSRALMTTLAAIFLAVHVFTVFSTTRLPGSDIILVGNATDLYRLIGLFFSGTAFYLLQDRVPLSPWLALGAVGALCVSLSIPALATLGCALFGSYVLFAAAALGAGTPLEHINNRADISYGLYLYASPIGKLLLWWEVSDDLWVVGVLTWLFAIGAGTISWYLIEAPVMRWTRERWRKKRLGAASNGSVPVVANQP